MKNITSVEAQNRFGQLLDMVQREPVTITRHGRPTAFLVSPQDMDELLDARRKRSKALKDLVAWSAQAREGAKPATGKLTDAAANRLVHEAR